MQFTRTIDNNNVTSTLLSSLSLFFVDTDYKRERGRVWSEQRREKNDEHDDDVDGKVWRKIVDLTI